MPLSAEQRLKVGNRLAGLRDARGLTQDQICEQLGITRSYWSALERGTTSVSIGRLFDLAKLLKVDKNWLVWGHDESTTAAEKVRASNEWADDLEHKAEEAERAGEYTDQRLAQLEQAVTEAQSVYRTGIDAAIAKTWDLASDEEFRATVVKMAAKLHADEADVACRLIRAAID